MSDKLQETCNSTNANLESWSTNYESQVENYVVAQQPLQILRLSWRTFAQIYIVGRKFISKIYRLLEKWNSKEFYFVPRFEEFHTEKTHWISYIVCSFFLFMNFVILLQFWNLV